MKKNLRYQIGGWAMAFIMAFAACTDEDTPAVPKGKAGTLHIESVTVDDAKVGSRAVAEGGTTYGSDFPYNQAVTGFSSDDVMTLNLVNGSETTAYAKYNGTTWDIYRDDACTDAAEIKPGNGKKWNELSISIAPFTLTSDTDLSGDELTDEVLTGYGITLFADGFQSDCFLYGDKLEVGELNIDKELTSATLGAVSIGFKHANALLRLPESDVTVTGTYIQGGTAYAMTELATLWAVYTDGTNTYYSPLTEVGDYWQAIVPAGSSIKLTGFKAVLKTSSSTTFTLDLPFQTQASGGSATAMPTGGYALQPGYQYPLSLYITPSEQAVSLTAPSGKPGWNTNEVALVSPESELEWVAANGTVAAHFKVSGPKGLMLLNHWMTDQTGADITGIKGYDASVLGNLSAADKNSKNITLAADITLPEPKDGESNWIMMGEWESKYTGTFDGGGHRITGLVINGDIQCSGFFKCLSGTVKNLHFVNASVTDAAQSGVITCNNYGLIQNCSLTNCTVNGTMYVGGMVGINSRDVINNRVGIVKDCKVDDRTTVTNCSHTIDNTELGGIVGSLEKGLVHACMSAAKVSAAFNSPEVGGIVGRIGGDSDAAVVACGYFGTLTNSTDNSIEMDGIAGNDVGNNANVYGSWATGYAVTGDGCYTTLDTSDNYATNLNDDEVIMQMNRAVIAYNNTATEANKATKGWQADTDADTDDYPDYVDLSTLNLGNYELEWVVTNQGTTPKYFRVTGPHGLQLLNRWMTGQTGANITGIVGYDADDLNISDTYTRQGKHITIAADITLPEVADGKSNWIPLSAYHGSINGGNHTISGLRIHKSTNYTGFVAELKDGGKIENLKFENAKVSCSNGSWIGIVAGKCSFGGTITNCQVDVASEVSGYNIVGGIVGQSEGGLNDDSSPALTRISNCQNRAKVSGTSTAVNAYVGGIVGFMQYSVVERCSNYGAVSSNNITGGIVGKL